MVIPAWVAVVVLIATWLLLVWLVASVFRASKRE